VDRELVVRAQDGDHEAFARIAATSIANLDSIARLILRDDEAASDAVQDALIAAWRGIRGLRDPDRIEAWLYRLTVRACQDRARRDRRRRVLEIHLPSPGGTSGTDPETVAVINDLLERGLSRLSAEQRAALVLTYYVDLPLADVAAVLGIPLGTLKSRLHRSLAALRAAVEADGRSASLNTESLA
jgi:RNA polymerase sigma-70 factor (ECF subfamily)